jgi:hypothetical protein
MDTRGSAYQTSLVLLTDHPSFLAAYLIRALTVGAQPAGAIRVCKVFDAKATLNISDFPTFISDIFEAFCAID